MTPTPRITDRDEIRSLLETDRGWSVYALGDLSPGLFEQCELQSLYADGEPSGEAPDFFSPSMLEEGIFFGIYEDEALTAAAGTHLVAPSEGVAAIGNVYTRRDRRGHGLAARVTTAVTTELLRMGLRTVALNVSQYNSPALRVYERLGFTRYCPFYEGIAIRGATAGPPLK